MTTQELLDLTFRYVGRRRDATPGLRLLYLNEAQRDLSIDFFFDELETLDTDLVTEINKSSYSVPGVEYIIEQMKNLGTAGTNGGGNGGGSGGILWADGLWADGLWADGLWASTPGPGPTPVVTSRIQDYALDERDWDWYNFNHADDLNFTGPPDIWTMHQGKIHFDPTPDGAYMMRITGRRTPVNMSISPPVQPTLPSDWHLILAMQASADLLFLFGNDARAMILKNEYLGKISTKQEKRTLRRVRESGQMKVQFANPLRRSRSRRSRRRRIFED